MSQSDMPENALLVVLALLGAAGLLVLLGAGAAAALLTRRLRWAAKLAGGGAAVIVAYAAVLLAFSLTSEEKTLKPGDRKYFCEIDCHLAYSVEGVEISAIAGATRYAVSIKTWFDPNTIASFRGDSPLTPNPRVAFLVDEAGRRYPALPGQLRTLSRPLRPGESHQTVLSFILPRGSGWPQLFLGDPPGFENLLIGHENGLLHRRIFFSLGPRG